MKTINLVISFLLVPAICLAQNNGIINLKKGQKFNVNTQTTTHIVTNGMGQDIETNSDATARTSLSVDNASAAGYTLSSVVTAMKINFSVMGQEMSYDSEHPDESNPIAAEIDKLLKGATVVTVDRTGKVINTSLPDDMPAAVSQMMGSGAGVKSLLLGISKNAKVGDVFEIKDVDSVLGTTTTLKYTVKSSSANNIALTFTGTVKTDTKVENQGVEVHNVTEGPVEGEATLNALTGMIKTSRSTVKIKGTASAMGMDMPVEGEITTNIEVSES